MGWALSARVSAAIELTIGAHKLLIDVLFGGALQLVLLIVSMIPFSSELHVVFLFRTNKHGLRASSRKQTEGAPQTVPARRKLTALFSAGEASHKTSSRAPNTPRSRRGTAVRRMSLWQPELAPYQDSVAVDRLRMLLDKWRSRATTSEGRAAPSMPPPTTARLSSRLTRGASMEERSCMCSVQAQDDMGPLDEQLALEESAVDVVISERTLSADRNSCHSARSA